jgi:hypothetical protein
MTSFLIRDEEPVYCAIVCDGAGSAIYGGIGAWNVCRIFSTAIKSHFRTTSLFPLDDDIWEWINQARDRLSAMARIRNSQRRDFASTLVVLLARKNEQLIIHIGDGAIIGRDKSGAWQTLSWPENGEYASTTYFVSDDPTPKTRIEHSNYEMDGYAVFSDGIEDLALDVIAVAPHTPFFRTMLAPLDNLDIEGKHVGLSIALGSFLSGSRVCDKTDDDKTLILVSAQ